MPEWSAEDRREQAERRLHILLALRTAQDSAVAVVEALAELEADDDAVSALQERFGFDAVQAVAVLDTQFRRVTREQRRRIEGEIDERRREIETLDGGV